VSRLIALDFNETGQRVSIVQPNTVLEAPSARQRSGKYLVFHLGGEEFGVHVLRVKEIMGLQEITMVPQTAPFVKGVINLRGKVIPVVDLRIKCQLPDTAYTRRTCIVVVQVHHLSGVILMGVIVDGVSEVVTLHEADIEDTPDFGDGLTLPYILGMAKIKGKVKILMDIDAVLTAQEVTGLEQLARLKGEE
jgi:purine-binding chemotaxis protein CheW